MNTIMAMVIGENDDQGYRWSDKRGWEENKN